METESQGRSVTLISFGAVDADDTISICRTFSLTEFPFSSKTEPISGSMLWSQMGKTGLSLYFRLQTRGKLSPHTTAHADLRKPA